MQLFPDNDNRSSFRVAFRTGMDRFLFNATKGEAWREGRNLLDRGLRPGATVSYRQMMQDNTYMFLSQLLASPTAFRHHINLSVGSLSYIVVPLTAQKPSGKTYYVTHVWLRPEGGR